MASKKKLIRKVRREQKMSPKAKAKVKKAIQIQRHSKRMDGRRKAREEVAKKSSSKRPSGDARGDLEKEISAVDKLFATVGEGEEEENAEPLDDGSDSSAGGFRDIGEDEGVSDVEGLDDEEGELDGEKHVAELKAIREKDPEFYNFLVESDKDLLQFQLPDAEGEEGDEEAAQKGPRVCSMERLHKIHSAAENTLSGVKAAMNIFHVSVRGIAGMNEQENLEEEQGQKRRAKLKKRRVRPYHLKVDDEAVFSAAIEWSLTNQQRVFKIHAGILLDKSVVMHQKKKQSKRFLNRAKKAAEKAAAEGKTEEEDVVDPTRYEHWKRLQIVNKVYWQDVCFLLTQSVGQMQHYVLRHISTPNSIAWLWPLKSLRTLLLRKCTMIWCSADSHTSRMLAFLFLRNTGVMSTKLAETRKLKEPLLDDIIRLMVKGFAQAASMGFSWRSHSTFRFMENCFVEMLRLDNDTAYRLGYVCIRQLAVVLRNSCIAVTHGEGKKKGQRMSMARGRKRKVTSEKQAQKRSSYKKAIQALVAWPFVRAMYLWTKAISLLPTLRDLAFPLSMVILGAAKTNMERVQNFPFVFHCFVCQNRLGMALEVYVPISSHIMKLWNVLISAMEKAYRKRRSISGKEGSGLVGTKAPDLEVLCHFRESQILDGPALDAVGHNLHFLLVDHMGTLSRSPAFPELSSMVLTHIRRVRKKCRSETLRRELTSFITAAEATAEDLRAKREALTEAPTFSKFFLFPATTAMAKMRETLLKQKANDEKQRIEAEEQRAIQEKEDRAGGPKRKLERLKKSKEEKKEKKAQKKKEEEEEAAKEKRRKVPKLGKGKDDMVEEMQFSSNEED